MISNLTLLSLAIAKAALYTGIGPAIAIVLLYEISGVRIARVGVEQVRSGRERPHESGPGQMLGSNPRVVPDLFSATPQVSASGQLATRDFPEERETLAAMTPSDWATSPPRKVRAA